MALVFGTVAATVTVHLRPPQMVPSDSGPQVELQVVLVMDWLGWKTKQCLLAILDHLNPAHLNLLVQILTFDWCLLEWILHDLNLLRYRQHQDDVFRLLVVADECSSEECLLLSSLLLDQRRNTNM